MLSKIPCQKYLETLIWYEDMLNFFLWADIKSTSTKLLWPKSKIIFYSLSGNDLSFHPLCPSTLSAAFAWQLSYVKPNSHFMGHEGLLSSLPLCPADCRTNNWPVTPCWKGPWTMRLQLPILAPSCDTGRVTRHLCWTSTPAVPKALCKWGEICCYHWF